MTDTPRDPNGPQFGARYEIIREHQEQDPPIMAESDEGGWVAYEDFAALRAMVEELEAIVNFHVWPNGEKIDSSLVPESLRGNRDWWEENAVHWKLQCDTLTAQLATVEQERDEWKDAALDYPAKCAEIQAFKSEMPIAPDYVIINSQLQQQLATATQTIEQLQAQGTFMSETIGQLENELERYKLGARGFP